MIKLLLATAAIAVAMANTAQGADLPFPVKALPPIAPYNWTGFYAGGNIGYSFGNSSNGWNYFANGANAAATSGTCRPAGSALCAFGSDSDRLNGVIGGA